MPWYKTGTVSVTQNSNAVIGTGTAFIANSRVGDGFRGPDGRWYEVTNIASNTALSISPNYEGPTVAGGFYSIMPVQGYQKDLSDQVRAILNSYGEKLAALGTTGNYDILPANKGGTGITDLSVFIQGMLNDPDAPAARTTLGAAKSGANSDITALSGLTVALTSTQGGVGDGYIDGLIPLWLNATSITITPGSAYIPSLAKCITSPVVTLSGLSLSSNTWYYLYIYNNSGTAAYELSTTVPAGYSGTAKVKTGDSSRRFISALRAGNSGLRPFVWAYDYVNYIDMNALYPILNNGTATGATVVSGVSAIPPTTRRSLMQVYSAIGNTLNIGIAFDTMLLSVTQNTRVLAPIICTAEQVFVYVHAGTVTGGTILDIRGYGSER
jgi:hypothetical protein